MNGYNAFITDSKSGVDDLRVTMGPSNTTGRLEVFHEGHWGLVCNDGSWKNAAALVACRQIGYTYGRVFNDFPLAHGIGEILPYWLHNATCIGNETNLNECKLSSWGGTSCVNHATVHCSNQSKLNIA